MTYIVKVKQQLVGIGCFLFIDGHFHQLLILFYKHKWELEYQQAITYDDSSCLAFFHYATKQMREKLQIYDELEELQERSGGVSAVILIALGTLIWLIS